MYVVEIFLPLAADGGPPFPSDAYAALREQMTQTFGGVTAFTRAPAKGLWKDEQNRVQRDDVVIFEVMTPSIDREWWTGLRKRLEQTFKQKEVLIRAHAVEKV